MFLRIHTLIGLIFFLGVSIVEANDDTVSDRRYLHQNDEDNYVAEYYDENGFEETEGNRELRPYNYGYRPSLRQRNYNRGYGMRQQYGYQAPKKMPNPKFGKTYKAGKSSKNTPKYKGQPVYKQVNRYPQRGSNSYLGQRRWEPVPGEPMPFVKTGPIPILIIDEQGTSGMSDQEIQDAINNAEGAAFPLEPTDDPTRRPTHKPTKKPSPRPTRTPTRRPTSHRTG